MPRAADPAILNNLGIVQLRRPAGCAPGTRGRVFPRGDAGRQHRLRSVLQSRLRATGSSRDLTERHLLAARNGPAQSRPTMRRITCSAWRCRRAGSTTEAAREKELARRLSSDYAEWEAKQPAANDVPRGLERIKTDVDVPASLRVERCHRRRRAAGPARPGRVSPATRAGAPIRPNATREAIADAAAGRLSVARTTARGAPAARPRLPAERPGGRSDRRVQDRDLERGHRRRASGCWPRPTCRRATSPPLEPSCSGSSRPIPRTPRRSGCSIACALSSVRLADAYRMLTQSSRTMLESHSANAGSRSSRDSAERKTARFPVHGRDGGIGRHLPVRRDGRPRRSPARAASPRRRWPRDTSDRSDRVRSQAPPSAPAPHGGAGTPRLRAGRR